MSPRFIFITFLALCCYGKLNSQVQKTERDSLRNLHDSAKIARDSVKNIRDSLNVTQDSLTFTAIQTYSQRSKLTKIIYGWIFKPIAHDPPVKTKKIKTKKIKPPPKLEGKIIRDIQILVLDPFGYNINDTSIHPQSFLIKTGNKIHIKTQKQVIHDLLLFKKNETYDSLLVNESERLIRSQKYVREVLFKSIPKPGKGDSVDIHITVADVWSTIPAVGISNSELNIGIKENNFSGMGDDFLGELQRNRITGSNVARFSYLKSNIRRSFVSFNFQYLLLSENELNRRMELSKNIFSPTSSDNQYLFSGSNNILKSIEFSRTFYSPIVKWAGGLFLGQLITTQSYYQSDSIRYLSYLTNIQDYWIAKSWQIFKEKNTEGRITSLILSGRFLRIKYPDKPVSEPMDLFNRKNIYFTGIGITSRKYIKDKYIFNYGKIEDVPIGRTFNLTLGFDVQKSNRLYVGLSAAWGNYYKFGYLSTHFEYGTFTGLPGLQQQVITGRFNYYTRLLDLGNWKIRQFIRPTLIFGINRLPEDNLTFIDGMKGIGLIEYNATHMGVITLQTQSYAPWNLVGFRFGPFFFTSIGILGNESPDIGPSRIYSLLGLGLLIKNDYLIFKTFQISLTFFPFIPDKGYNIFRTNAYKTSDYGFRDFNISKPGLVVYR